jgi:AbrB family transcriptional regulator, stage V sporulation protein T
MSSVFHARIGAGGRIVIPSQARDQLHLDEGSEVVIEVADDGLRISSLKQTIQEIQSYCRQFVRDGESVADELVRERHDEARRE